MLNLTLKIIKRFAAKDALKCREHFERTLVCSGVKLDLTIYNIASY